VHSSYLVVGSPGQGNWAETPWVAVFDPLETETAQEGIYVVYLLRGDGGGLYLSLNQGTTAVLNRVGRTQYLKVLADNAAAYAGLLGPQEVADLFHGPIDLGGTKDLSRGYEAGNVIARYYDRDSLPVSDEDLNTDLNRLLSLYRVLLEAREALMETPAERSEESVPRGVEALRYSWHRRAERNAKLARDAKRFHGHTCTVCGFNFANRYGEVGQGYIEAHHLTPLASLGGRPTELDPKTDFTVVCSNCHRMLHRASPPMSPIELSRQLS
jgi:5-methylcytosine-specific restriction enzyme A